MTDLESQGPQVIQASVKGPHVPSEIRINFVKKVYGILIAMLAVSFGIAAPFVFIRDSAVDWVNHNMWVVGVATALLLVHQLFNLAMALEMCVGSGSCFRAYLRLFVTVPWNYIFLFSYAACFGVLLGLTCSAFKAESVSLVFVLTAGIMAALTVYAAVTKTDFTGCGMYLFAMMIGLILMGIVAVFVPYDSPFHRALSAIGAILFSFVIIYDTQLIFGTVSQSLNNSAARRVEFTIDMYAFAAYQLYLDFVNMFLYLLQLFGARRD